MDIGEVSQNLRSGHNIVTDLPLNAARREVADLNNGALVDTVRGLLSILMINGRQLQESIRPKLDVVAEGGRFTKACLDAAAGIDPTNPNFTRAGQAAKTIHESGKFMLDQADHMHVSYEHARVFLERALNSLSGALQTQNAISSELAAVTGPQVGVLRGIEALEPNL